MFWFIIDVVTMRRLGLGKPFRYALLLLLGGCLIAGLIYTYIVIRAVNERSLSSNVHGHSTH
jgi:hypothetical protein